MTPEQQRIRALEETVLLLIDSLEEARIGFGTRFASRLRLQMRQNREAHRFLQKKVSHAAKPEKPEAPEPQPTPPAAPEEEGGGAPA